MARRTVPLTLCVLAGLGLPLLAGCAGATDDAAPDGPAAATTSAPATPDASPSPTDAAEPTAAEPTPSETSDGAEGETRDIVMGDHTISVPASYSASSEGPVVTLREVPNSQVTIQLGPAASLGDRSLAEFCDSFVPPEGVADVDSGMTPLQGREVCSSHIAATTPEEVAALLGEADSANAEAMGSMSSTQLVLLSPDGTQAVRVHGIHVPLANGALERDIAAQFLRALP